MSKFNSLLENHLKSTDLLRIRVKFDPANESEQRREYVGYVLEEDGAGGVIAIVPDMGADSMSLGPDQFELDPSMQQDCGDPLSKFKKHLVDFLMARGYHDQVSDNMEVIVNANHPIELEKVLKTCGCDGGVVLDMYRDFVTHG
jgi:hypothetical protein